MLEKQLLILLIIFSSQHALCFVSESFELMKLSWNLGLLINDASFMHDTGVKFTSAIAGDEDEVIKKLITISDKLDDFKGYTRDKLNNIGVLINLLPDEIEIRSTKKDIEEFIVKTNEKWDTLMRYVKKRGTKEEYSFIANAIIDSIGENLSKFRNNITPLFSTQSGLFMLLANVAREKRDIVCDKGETYHDTVTRLYQIILVTEVKAHNLLSFAYGVKFPGNQGNALLDSVKNNLKEQFPRYMEEYKRSLTSTVLPYLRACDPKTSWRRGEDFHELERFIQRRIYRITYPFWKGSDNDRARALLNPHSACEGESYDCKSLLTLWRDTDVCLWNEGPYSIRYIHHASDKIGMDTKNPCPPNDLYEYRSWSGGDRGNWFLECMCHSSRWKFAAFQTQSRVADNYVIVGLRLNIFRNYVYIQIAQGKLESNGYVANYSWIQPEEMEWPSWNEGNDYHLTKTNRAFFFTDAQLPPGYILTGVNFYTTKSKEISGFSMEISGVKFDYETGKLDINQKTSSRGSRSDENLELKYPGSNSFLMDPPEPHVPDSQGFTYLNFRDSNRETDFGQSTLPLLDAVPVITNPLKPIGGVGMFHKGDRNYGGFLSLRLYPINYVYFVDTFSEKHNVNLTSTWEK